MRRAVVTLVALIAGACGQGEHRGHASVDERAHLAAGVVARVGATSISGADVERERSEKGGASREALDRLIAARLLAAEAERRGYGRRADVADATERVSVQVLLARRVEDEVPERSVTDADVAAAYEAAGARFRVPEQRGSLHVLVQIPRDAPEARSNAARALCERARLELAAATDLDAVLARWSAMHGGPFEIRAEHVPATAPDGGLVAEYLTALFAIDRTHLPQVASAPVRTQFGWHAMVLTDVVPGRVTPLASVAVQLRTEVVTRRRRARLDVLLAELAQRTPPIAEDDVVRRLIAGSP